MRHTVTTAAAVLLAATALTLAGCSNNSSGKPAPSATVTVTKTPALSAAERRAACVTAWAKVLHADADADVTADKPPACANVPDSDQLDVYVEGMQQRNRENRGQ